MKRLLYALAALVLVGCSHDQPHDWGYGWLSGRNLYLSTCFVRDSIEVKDMQVNALYYYADQTKGQVLPCWNNYGKSKCEYVTTRKEDGYVCDVYHTDEVVYCGDKRECFAVPVDCYVVLRFVDGTKNKVDRLVDIQVYHTDEDRASTQFTLLVDELRNTSRIGIY